MTYDTIIRGGTIVTPDAAFEGHLGLRAGRIVALSSEPLGEAGTVIEAAGLLVMPGVIDLHVHLTAQQDDPSFEVREGSGGAAAGGVTTLVEMPHSAPPATSLAAFRRKQALMAAHCVVDFALWAGLDGANDAELPALVEAGALGFKAFLCSGAAGGEAPDHRGLPRLDDDGLLRAMRVLAPLGAPIGIHAENHDMLRAAQARLRAAGRHDTRAHAEAGPEIAEIEAVARVVTLARETGARCHVVHLSSARAGALIAAGGADVSAETCPHYLSLDEEDLVRIGADARCGPPLRPRPVVEALWGKVLDGTVSMIASDHCPYPIAQKRAGDASIWEAGMGLTGIQTMLPVFLEEALARGLSLPRIAALLATNPAKRFGLAPRKGAIVPGADADLVLVDPDAPWVVRGAEFPGHGRWSAFEGRRCTARVVRTLLRGRSVFAQGRVLGAPGGGAFVRAGG